MIKCVSRDFQRPAHTLLVVTHCFVILPKPNGLIEARGKIEKEAKALKEGKRGTNALRWTVRRLFIGNMISERDVLHTYPFVFVR